MNPQIERLNRLNAVLRHKLERAELSLPMINNVLDQLSRLNLLGGMMILGNIIHHDSHLSGNGDSGNVYLAALSLPGGIGVAILDVENYEDGVRATGGIDRAARNCFVPVDQCSLGIQSLLVDQVPELLDRLLSALVWAMRAGS